VKVWVLWRSWWCCVTKETRRGQFAQHHIHCGTKTGTTSTTHYLLQTASFEYWWD